MTKGEPALAEQCFGIGPGDARAELGFTGDLVKGVQRVEAAQVDGDDRGKTVTDRVQAAHHTGAAAEGHHGDPMLRAVAEDG